jgi:hypothetical protein
MIETTITVIIEDRTYRLGNNDPESIGRISDADRRQLISVLEQIKEQEQRVARLAQQAVARSSVETLVTARGEGVGEAGVRSPAPERLGSGDADALMARLIMEEQRERKPAPTTRGFYTLFGGIIAIVLLLVMIL